MSANEESDGNNKETSTSLMTGSDENPPYDRQDDVDTQPTYISSGLNHPRPTSTTR